MPLVHIDLLEGRTPEQLKKMAADVTTAIAKDANVPADDIHIVLNEMKHDHYFVAGKEKGQK
ncbi:MULTISPECIES: 2-hydroxymuconate tautomerase [Loigolactobacillus]|uniref:4-oxalocrotonate tautomerase n=1 Tax=Loigolactobacillus backii TaxID=375175 RepID=A0A192H3Q9_9LACO|nr:MULTISPECIES: 2-hydroxymuconate tautomerase [Loigolactobacillus]ANK59414.1 4-oxalocrotonate tautomerase [Loigolactobacillus backii]ANK63005.1 4-oxalocrotonate tautomerase [Loigolactobacillus backii]ANK64408.1 4-oxalocrotonate tautomerase [Loigolactobacillus backii]ANK67198.1 4-oxalocrotonate tautomerase [Loigolactobacillus backii]ANK69987.1 4-oxalocrotonate tautomerase [Loigolactobacillus backii]